MNSVLSKKVIARFSAAVFAVAAVTAVDSATANASTGGGCSTQSTVRVCISANGQGLDPDYYLLSNGNDCSFVMIYVVDETTGKTIWSDNQVNSGCVVGHHGPWRLISSNTGGGVANGHRYHAIVEEFLGGDEGGIIAAQTPTQTLSY